MAFRIIDFAFVLLCLLLVTEARKMEFLPSEDDEYCHYLGQCNNNNNNADEDCMTKCTKNGYNSAGAFCKISVTPMCCCLLDKKSMANSSDDQYCHYLGTCANRNNCMMNCTNIGFHAGANCEPVATSICCCLKDKKSTLKNIP